VSRVRLTVAVASFPALSVAFRRMLFRPSARITSARLKALPARGAGASVYPEAKDITVNDRARDGNPRRVHDCILDRSCDGNNR